MDEFLRLIAAQAALQPAALAVEEDGLCLTYRDLHQVSDRVAQMLQDAGAGPGGTACYLGVSILRRIVVLLAGLKANIPVAILNPRDPPQAVADIAHHAGATHQIVGSPGLEATTAAIGLPPIDIMEIPGPAAQPFRLAKAAAGDTAYYMYTSGSSGRPKGVPTSRAAAAHFANLEIAIGSLVRGDRVGVFGQVWMAYLLGGLYVGATLCCCDFAGRGGAGVAAWMRQRRITYAEGYPAMLRSIMAAADQPIEGLRGFLAIGEPLIKADVEKFERLFPGATLLANYGSTEYYEMTGYVHQPGTPFPYNTVPLGQPIEPEYFHLLGPDGQPVPAGERGEVVIASPFLPPGYHNDPERSAQVFQTDPVAGERRYHTGDYAFYDAAGVLHSAGRADDQIKVRGYTLRTSDVEQEILGFPGIAKVAVAGFPGPRGTTRLACHFETVADAPPPETMRAALRARMPAYMVPGYWVRHDALPLTSTGKVMRTALPNPLEMPGRLSEAAASPETKTERTLAEIWREVLGHGDFGRQEDFFDIGGDSLQAMEVLTLTEQRFDRRIPLETLILEGASIANLAAVVEALGEEAGPAGPVALNRPGEPSPLAALHVIGGHLSDYLELAHAFDCVRPMLGVGPHGLSPGGTPDAAIDAIASHAAATLRRAFPGRPPALIGFSAGGAFALETARILAASGEAPALILLDANCAWLDRLRWFRSTWRGIKKGETQAVAQHLANRLTSAAGYGAPPANADEAHLRALLDHHPKPLTLPRALLVAGEEGQVRPDERAEWQRLLGPGLETVTVPGDHMSMIRAPNVGALAQMLEAWLRG